MKTFAIHESNLERLQKKVNRIRNKCLKYGCDFHYAEIGEEFQTWTDDEGYEHTSRYVIVEAEGTAVVNGWVFAATLDHTAEGNIVRSCADVGVEIPSRYYNAEPVCEHCNSKRHRKNTYIVYNQETQEFKQVGSSCLCDFTHGLSAEGVAGYIELFDCLMEFEVPGPGWNHVTYMKTVEVMDYALDYVTRFGYEPSDPDFPCTKSRVIDAWLYDNFPNRLSIRDTEEIQYYRKKYSPKYGLESTYEYIHKMFDHVLGLEDSNNYIHNLKVIAQNEYIKIKDVGYAVSMIPLYNKHVEVESYRAKIAKAHTAEVEGSNFVGEVKDRITIENPTVTAITSWESCYNGYSPTITTRYKIVDESGNVFMWDSSTGIFVGEDNEYHVASIKGTVKKHDTYNDVKQTWLTRCKVEYKPVCKEEKKIPYTGPDYNEILDDFENYVENEMEV